MTRRAPRRAKLVTAGIIGLAASVLAACSAGATAPATAPTDAATSSIEATSPPPGPSLVAPTPSVAPSVVVILETKYTGTFEGGGTVNFTVSPDGRQLTAFLAEFPPCGIPGGTVSMNSDNGHVPLPVSIDSGTFTFGVSPSYVGTGQLLPNGVAEGTVTDPGNPDGVLEQCRVATVLTWKAAIVP